MLICFGSDGFGCVVIVCVCVAFSFDISNNYNTIVQVQNSLQKLLETVSYVF